MLKINSNLFLLLACLLLVPAVSCKKFVEVDPPVTNPVDKTVYNSNATAAAVLTGVYSRMMENFAGLSGGANSISLLAGLSADEFNYYSSDPVLAGYYINSVQPINSSFWPELYKYIYTANAAIEGITGSDKLNAEIRNQLLGEAYFVRAFNYFYLVNLFGDVPLHLTTDYHVTSTASKAGSIQVYQQIIEDLKKATELLSDDYRTPAHVVTSERIRPNKAAATALLARAYLYTGSYSEAETSASTVINNVTLFYLAEDLETVFLKNSSEAIWQLRPVVPDFNTFDGNLFMLFAAPDYAHPVALNPALVQLFEPGDKRLSSWVGRYIEGSDSYYFPQKYRVISGPGPVDEYLMVLRLSEQYLIRAEARAQQGNLSGAREDINALRTRAGATPITSNDKGIILQIIEQERQMELFSEWGHRWMDLKRTDRVDAVMNQVAPTKGGTWNSFARLYPIPQAEIQNNPNIHQNPGY